MTNPSRSLAAGNTKVWILTSKPANVLLPTTTELAAGIDASANILASDFTFTATDSDKVNEASLATINNANALGPSNFDAGFTLFRQFDGTTKNPDSTGDAAYAACKVKGTTLWIYARRNAKLSTAAVAVGDVLFMGGEFITDTPQIPGTDGFVKSRIPLEPQNVTTDIVLAA